MRVDNIEFAKFSKFNSLRLSSCYELPKLAYPYEDFYSFLSFIESGSRPKGGIREEDFGQALSLGGEQICKDGTINTEKLPYVSNDFYDEAKKGLIQNGDILICKDGALTGKTGIVDTSTLPTNRIMINEHVFAIRANEKIRQRFLYYLLRTDIFYNQVLDFAYRKKAQPGLTLDHVKAMKLPEIPIGVQDAILLSVKPYEEKINRLKKKKINIQDNIDKVFQSEFGFDYDKFKTLREKKIYNVTCISFSNNPDLRFGAKFHRPAGIFVEQELKRKTHAKIKDYLNEPIVLGASVSPKDYDDGEYLYISMATIKTWNFDKEAALTVNNNYVCSKKEKTVKKNDIIMARSGEGTIGKVAIIKEDIKGIFADFTMRIRLKNYNSEFAYYYFRTTYFQYLIEIYKKGLGNNTNIFPIVVREFPIPDISLKKQGELVRTIRKKIKEQSKISMEIEKQQELIDNIIKTALFK